MFAQTRIAILVAALFSLTGCELTTIQFAPSKSIVSLSPSPIPSFEPGKISCGSPSSATTQTANGLVSADTPSSDGTRLWALGASFPIVFTTDAGTSDLLSWSIEDQLGNIRGSGTFPILPGPYTYTLTCTSSYAGYLAIHATLTAQGGSLPTAGTRPPGIATFGILPNVTSVLPRVTYAHPDQHRFGMQGFNGDLAMLSDLGVTQTIDNRQLSSMEPNGPNTWTPSLNDGSSFSNGQIERLIRLDGIPAWASPTGAATSSYAPTDLNYYQSYMARVGSDTAAIRQAYYPNQQYDYFQVTWEPPWSDTEANFVAMYKAVYNGLHSTDPQAMVMGPTYPFPATTTYWLQQYASLGLANYIDGIATHAYYTGVSKPSNPPEQQDAPGASNPAGALDNQMRALRAEMQAQYKPNMKLFATEVGICYDSNIAYGSSSITANELYAQAAVAVRTHIIVLGEGAQMTYFFFGPDYPSEIGFGTFFDIADPTGSYAASNRSPKPQALALAALTRILDGTNTLGYLKNLPANVHGYSFQQFNDGKVITALWVHNNAEWPNTDGVYDSDYKVPYSLTVDASNASGSVVIFDLMGNPSIVPYTNGVANLTLTEAPIYVVSNNESVMKANVTAPLGYTGQ